MLCLKPHDLCALETNTHDKFVGDRAETYTRAATAKSLHSTNVTQADAAMAGPGGQW